MMHLNLQPQVLDSFDGKVYLFPANDELIKEWQEIKEGSRPYDPEKFDKWIMKLPATAPPKLIWSEPSE